MVFMFRFIIHQTICSRVEVFGDIVRQIDMWFGSSVVEFRDGIPEVVGSNPGRARYFFTTCYICRPT